MVTTLTGLWPLPWVIWWLSYLDYELLTILKHWFGGAHVISNFCVCSWWLIVVCLCLSFLLCQHICLPVLYHIVFSRLDITLLTWSLNIIGWCNNLFLSALRNVACWPILENWNMFYFYFYQLMTYFNSLKIMSWELGCEKGNKFKHMYKTGSEFKDKMC